MSRQSSYTYSMNFSRARLRGHRHGRGITRADLGARAGISESQVQDIEAGQRALDVDDLLVDDLARALGVPRTELTSDSSTYAEDYCAAVLLHAQPLTEADVAQAAAALRPAVVQ